MIQEGIVATTFHVEIATEWRLCDRNAERVVNYVEKVTVMIYFLYTRHLNKQ